MYTLETTNAEKSKENKKMLNIHLKSLRKNRTKQITKRVNRHTMCKPTKPKVSSFEKIYKIDKFLVR